MALENPALDESAVNENNDSDTVVRAQNGDSDALEFILDKYKNLVSFKARLYFLAGADKEDIVQEGMIGLYKAVRDFNPEKQVNFRSFAELCITRQIITAIKTATRMKHQPLNTYVSLNKPAFGEESDKTMLDTITGSEGLDPEKIYIDYEDYKNIENKIGEMLSRLEWQVLTLYLSGKSYHEIAAQLGRPEKSVDNALQRIKAKIETYVKNR